MARNQRKSMKREETAEQAQLRRDADAARKREERQKAREEKARAEQQKKLGEAPSFPEYWAAQRVKIERAEYEAREQDVLDLEWLVKQFLDGTYEQTATEMGFTEEERVTLPQLIAEVREEVAAHGLCESIVLIIPRLWSEDEKSLRESILVKGGSTAQLLQYGYRLGLDSRLYEDFYQKFMKERTQLTTCGAAPGYALLKCSQCNALPISVSAATAEAYRRTNNFLCQNCLDKRAKGRDFYKGVTLPENQLFDSWGRLKTQ
jgi:hypothetical protein